MHPEGGCRIMDSTLNSFVFFVPFVVRLPNLIVPTLQRGNAVRDAPASRIDGASDFRIMNSGGV
jgi:hypothetical protein